MGSSSTRRRRPPAWSSRITRRKATGSGTYGTQGYDIADGSTGLPSYATVTPIGATNFIWTTTTSDPRALQTVGSSNRVAACWYDATTSSFSVDVDLTDGQAHDLAIYLMDYPSEGCIEQVQVSNAATGAVLDTETISNFSGGIYLQWKLSGNVLITFTWEAGPNAMLNGIFFDPPTAIAGLVEQDSTTEGNGIGTSGTQGNDIADCSAGLPSFSTFTPIGASNFIWTTDTSDPRALQTVGSSNRVAACWYATTSFSVDVDLTDGQVHDLAIYLMDYPSKGRIEQVRVSNAATGAVLDTETISNFSGGIYLQWRVSGNVLLTFTCEGGPNAMLNGIFFDPPTATASVAEQDSTTAGNWIATRVSGPNARPQRPVVRDRLRRRRTQLL